MARTAGLAVEVTCTEHGPMTRIQGGWRCDVPFCRYVGDGFLAQLLPHSGFVPAPPGVSISVITLTDKDI